MKLTENARNHWVSFFEHLQHLQCDFLDFIWLHLMNKPTEDLIVVLKITYQIVGILIESKKIG